MIAVLTIGMSHSRAHIFDVEASVCVYAHLLIDLLRQLLQLCLQKIITSPQQLVNMAIAACQVLIWLSLHSCDACHCNSASDTINKTQGVGNISCLDLLQNHLQARKILETASAVTNGDTRMNLPDSAGAWGCSLLREQ